MVMKRNGALALYRAAPPAEPSAATDALILSAARARRASRLPAHIALAAAVALVAVFAARWMTPGEPPAPEITVTHFGVAEGQAHAWLVTFQPTLTATGPGSQEGRP
jgi:hypothetical protein